MLNRGQVSIFVIIGIVILALAIGLFYLSSKAQETKLKTELSEAAQLPIELQQQKEEIEYCLSNIITEAAKIIGNSGGYIINKPARTINYKNNDIAYIESVSKEKIETEINNYVKENFGKCKDDSIAEGAEAQIEDDKITATAEMPLTLESRDSSARISFFQAEADIRLGRMLNLIGKIRQDTDCITCIIDETEKNNMKATINILDNAKIMVIEDESYSFSLAVD